MKKILLLAFLLNLFNIAFAQSYSRSSITPIYLKHSGGYLNFVKYADSVSMLSKYDYNYYGNNSLAVPFQQVSPFKKVVDDLENQITQLRLDKSTDFSKIKYLKGELKAAEEKLHIDDSMREILLTKTVIDNKICNKILSSILIDPSLGYMSTETIFKRAEYNASDADFVKAMNSEAKLDAIKIKGIDLLKNVYFIIFDSYNQSENSYDKEHPQNKTISVNSTAFLYQIDIDSLVRIGQFDQLIFTEKDPAKAAQFANFNFPLKLVMKVNVSASTENYKTESNVSGKSLLSSLGSSGSSANVIKYTYKSNEEIGKDLVNGLLSSADFKFTQKYEPFKVKVSVFSAKPILAKVGAKEGLKIDELFKVTETVLSNKGEKYDKKIGWVRVRKVADNKKNADGKMDPSSFYKVSCRRVEKGMKMTLKKEYGLDFGVAYNIGDENNVANGPMITVDYIIARIKPGLRVGLSVGGFGILSPETVKVDGITIPESELKFEGSNIYLDLTAKKILQANHIELTPQLGLYANILSMTKLNDISITEYPTLKGLANTAYGILSGLKFGYNFGPHFQFNMGYKIGFQLGSKLKKESGDVTYGGDPLTMSFISPNVMFFGLRIKGL